MDLIYVCDENENGRTVINFPYVNIQLDLGRYLKDRHLQQSRLSSKDQNSIRCSLPIYAGRFVRPAVMLRNDTAPSSNLRDPDLTQGQYFINELHQHTERQIQQTYSA